jgi:hypothetical protein
MKGDEQGEWSPQRSAFQEWKHMNGDTVEMQRATRETKAGARQ